MLIPEIEDEFPEKFNSKYSTYKNVTVAPLEQSNKKNNRLSH
jgi:hypothetical protein